MVKYPFQMVKIPSSSPPSGTFLLPHRLRPVVALGYALRGLLHLRHAVAANGGRTTVELGDLLLLSWRPGETKVVPHMTRRFTGIAYNIL